MTLDELREVIEWGDPEGWCCTYEKKDIDDYETAKRVMFALVDLVPILHRVRSRLNDSKLEHVFDEAFEKVTKELT